MLIRTENFEIEFGPFYLNYVRGFGFEVIIFRPGDQPYWWFAKNDPGEYWERWGFGRHVMAGRVEEGKAPAERGFDYDHPNNSIDCRPCSPKQA